MRYRGPYEYDKFTLNILNYINYVNDYIYDMNNTSEEFNTLKKMQDEIDDAFETMTKNSEIIYRYLIMNKGGE
jgi:hypothetical protein